MKLAIVVVSAMLFCAFSTNAQAREEREDLRFQPGVQLGGFAMAGDLDDLAWGAGVQGTLFKWGQLSFGGAGFSLWELNGHWKTSPYVELVTIDMSPGPGIVGLSFKYIFRNAFDRQGAPLDHGVGVGFVIGF